MIKKLFELLGLVVVIGEYYILYCVGAACWYGEPFPPFALTLARLYAYGFCAALVIGVVLLAVLIVNRFRRRRLGIIRFDRYGNLYYTKK